jgi:hypothetical protein
MNAERRKGGKGMSGRKGFVTAVFKDDFFSAAVAFGSFTSHGHGGGCDAHRTCRDEGRR